MTTLQQQAKALGDPTRFAIFRYVADAQGGVDVPELTAHLGINHNAVRKHLAQLVAAGLVVESTAPADGRGRPRMRYAPAPSIDSRWGATGPYERLSRLLAEITRTGDSAVEVGRRAVRRHRLGGGRATRDPVDVLVEQMAAEGFEPRVRRRGGVAELTLDACPFSSAAEIDPETVCNVHLGMAYGVAEQVEGLVIDELRPRDPRAAGCRLRCHVEGGALSTPR